jgi:hypothetical protein
MPTRSSPLARKKSMEVLRYTSGGIEPHLLNAYAHLQLLDAS